MRLKQIMNSSKGCCAFFRQCMNKVFQWSIKVKVWSIINDYNNDRTNGGFNKIGDHRALLTTGPRKMSWRLSSKQFKDIVALLVAPQVRWCTEMKNLGNTTWQNSAGLRERTSVAGVSYKVQKASLLFVLVLQNCACAILVQSPNCAGVYGWSLLTGHPRSQQNLWVLGSKNTGRPNGRQANFVGPSTPADPFDIHVACYFRLRWSRAEHTLQIGPWT